MLLIHILWCKVSLLYDVYDMVSKEYPYEYKSVNKDTFMHKHKDYVIVWLCDYVIIIIIYCFIIYYIMQSVLIIKVYQKSSVPGVKAYHYKAGQCHVCQDIVK